MDKGFFGSLFDLNHDGKLDASEQFLDYMAFTQVIGELEDDTDDGDEEESDD